MKFTEDAVKLFSAVVVVALIAGAKTASADASMAQNAFVCVYADGVKRENGRDFSVTGLTARVVANPGWRLLTPSDVNLDGALPVVYRVEDYSKENSATGRTVSR